MQPTFMYSYNEGVRRWRDKSTVTVNQVSHVFCCGQWCRSDCEGLCTHTYRLVPERRTVHCFIVTQWGLYYGCLWPTHICTHTPFHWCFFAVSLASSTDPLKNTQEETHSSVPVPMLRFCVKKLWLRINDGSDN